jgi:hypothetical protein
MEKLRHSQRIALCCEEITSKIDALRWRSSNQRPVTIQDIEKIAILHKISPERIVKIINGKK